MKRLYALRGASQCLNTEADICEKISILYDELLSKNNLNEDDIVSLIFSVTADITAINPATALRKSGRGNELSLFAVREAECGISLPFTIRVLLHCYLDEGTSVNHIYRNGAENLRQLAINN